MASVDFTDGDQNYTNDTTTRTHINADIYLPKNDDGDFENNDRKKCCDKNYQKENYETSAVLKETSIKNQAGKKVGHRRIHSDGGISYKNINTSQIMESVRLGIQRSVGALSSEPERDVLMADFMTVESTPFTSDTSTDRKTEFIFKTYAPVAFRHLRDLFGIKPDNFVTSFCQAPLLELANAGASGSVFYLTQNDNYIIKTVQYREAEFLQKLLPGYFLNLSQNPCTLLPKFFGLYCYKRNTTNVRLIVMNNILPSDMKIHQKYDLKGSTYMRKASKTELQSTSPTYKDLDFMQHHPNGIYLMAEVYKNLIKTIQRDCRVLESFRIMDYSLLLGIHYIDRAKNQGSVCGKEIEEERSMKEEIINISSGGDGNYIPCEAEAFLTNDAEIKNNKNDARCGTVTFKDAAETRLSLERNKHSNASLYGIPAKNANGENLLLFVGIIDILQSYRFKKKVEHFFKSIVHESDVISVHNPAFYAHRFEDFFAHKAFKISPSPSKIKQKNTPLLNDDNGKQEN